MEIPTDYDEWINDILQNIEVEDSEPDDPVAGTKLGRAIYDTSDKLIVAADGKKSEIATTDANESFRSINLEAELTYDCQKTAGTQKSYNTYLKKFAECLGIEWNKEQAMAKEHFSDHNIASFMVHLSREHDFKPHIKKATLAALRSIMQFNGIKHWDENPSLWPWTLRSIEVMNNIVLFLNDF
jgi:hypothetical protein